MNYIEENFCMFEPSEVKMLAMHATDLYFQNMSQELKKDLLADPIKYTTMYAKIYSSTINEIESNNEFSKTRHSK